MEERNIAKYIDHTLLKANATEAQIRRLCEEASEYHFASVCVNTCYVTLAAELLKGSGVKTCCVVGFPLGAMSTAAKAFEAADAVKNGAEEVDMVINIGAVKFGDWDYVAKDIEEVVKASHDKALVKVIIETCLLTDDEKVLACRTAKEAGAAVLQLPEAARGFAQDPQVRLSPEAGGVLGADRHRFDGGRGRARNPRGQV